MTKIFIVIVTYNGMKWIEKCLNCLAGSTMGFQAIIIDNGSTDGTVSYIENNHSDILLIKSEENLGFAKANNLGMKIALEQSADFVFLLNQDCYIEPSTLGQLVKASLENKEYGILSPIHLNGGRSLVDYNFQVYLQRIKGLIDDYVLDTVKPVYQSEFVNAAAWMITRECLIKVGGFDTMIFFHYGEDNNYCQRVRYHGLKIGVVPSAKIEHDRFRSPSVFNYKRALTQIKIRVFDVNLSARESVFLFLRQVLKIGLKALTNLLKLQFKVSFLRTRMMIDLIVLYVGKVRENRNINKNVKYAWLT